jgi:hypothetical protein
MTSTDSGPQYQVSHLGKLGRATTQNHIQCFKCGSELRAIDVYVLPDGGVEWTCIGCHDDIFRYDPDIAITSSSK